MGYGQGSLKEREGKWLARYMGPDGRQRSKTFARKSDARDFLAGMQVDKARGTWIDPRGAQVPFDEWAWEWYEGRHHIGHARRAADRSLLTNHIVSRFGSTAIGRIGPLEVRSWVTSLVAKELSPRTIRGCYTIFSGIMRSAVAAKLIGEAPVGRGVVDLPALDRKRERVLTEAEVERLANQLDEHYRPLIYTAAYTGCRWQELAGLKREYLDLDKGILHVRGVTTGLGGSVIYKPCPKSDAGRRSIRLPHLLTKILEEHLADRPESQWVFVGPKGGMLRESNFRRPWSRAVASAGLSPLTFHDLRHTHAAWLIRDGAHLKALQQRLGHKDVSTTLNTYGHLFPNHDEEVVASLNARWEAARSGQENAKVFSLHGRA